MAINSRIIASGSYLPEKILTNNDLSLMVETSDEWIFERTGIKQRHIAANNQLTSDLAYQASIEAFKSSNISPKDIELIIVATTTPDLTFPATATILQSKIGSKKAFAFDIQAVCSGFVYALSIADNYIKSGNVKNALVVGAETLSRIVDWKDRNSCVLFGDGAGAVVLEACGPDNGIIASSLYSDGDLNGILKTNGGVSFNQKIGFIEMSGKEVFKHAVEKMSKCVQDSLLKAKIKVEDIDLLIPHQANQRILSAVATKIGIDQNKVIATVEKHANTSAASIPLAIDYATKNNMIKENDIIVLEALGGGLTWGSLVIKW